MKTREDSIYYLWEAEMLTKEQMLHHTLLSSCWPHQCLVLGIIKMCLTEQNKVDEPIRSQLRGHSLPVRTAFE